MRILKTAMQSSYHRDDILLMMTAQQYVGISAEEIETFFVDESFCHHEQQQFFNYSWNFVYCTKEDDGFYHKQYGVIIRPQCKSLWDNGLRT